MQYSVYRFIEDDLKTTPNKFAKAIGSKQSTFSTWKSRENLLMSFQSNS